MGLLGAFWNPPSRSRGGDRARSAITRDEEVNRSRDHSYAAIPQETKHRQTALAISYILTQRASVAPAPDQSQHYLRQMQSHIAN